MKLNKSLKRRIVNFLYVFIPAFLILLWITLRSAPFIASKITPYSSLGLYAVVEESSHGVFTHMTTTELHKGDFVEGKFKATEDNMGLILIRFFNFNRLSGDRVIFQLKQLEKGTWYYENSYKVDQFQPNEYFTFGFPIIQKARGNNYLFKITSVNGKVNNAIAISSHKPQFGIVYNFTRKELLHNPFALLRFAYKKLSYGLYHADSFQLISLLLAYYVWLYIVRKNKKNIFNFIKEKTIRKGMIKKSHYLYIARMYLKTSSFFKTKTQQLVRFYGLSKKYIIFSIAITIFIIAFVERYSFYITPTNYGRLLFWGIGGSGDYDMLFKTTMAFLEAKDKIHYVWSYVNDYPFLVRFYGFFFSTFGFITGLKYSIYLLMTISSFIAVMPFALLSRFKRFSFGGFLASLLLATNALPVWLASGRSVDTMTTIFFSAFVVLFILSLEKKNYFLAILLGSIGFVDGLNRGIMMVNDLPALFFFSILYIYTHSIKVNRFPFVKTTITELLYAVTPLAILLLLFAAWENWFFHVFRIHQFFIVGLLDFNNSFYHTHSNSSSLITILNLLFQIFLVLRKMIELIGLEYLGVIVLIGLLMLIKIKNTINKRILLLLILPFLISVVFSLQKNFIEMFPHSAESSKIFFLHFSIPNETNIRILIILEFFIIQFLFLKEIFLRYLAIIFFYLMLMAYGILTEFQDRHFIQVLIIFYILLGMSIDKIVVFDKKNSNQKNLVYIALATVLFIIGKNIYPSVSNSFSNAVINTKYINDQRSYLTYASKTIPHDGVVLTGVQGENFIWIYENTKRSVIFNINSGNPILIPYGKTNFHIPFAFKNDMYKTLPQKVSYISNSDVLVNTIFNSKSEFNKYNFYVLDYDIANWKSRLEDSQKAFPFLPPNVVYNLKQINKDSKNRPIYKLVLK